jgi:hypothetical protein
MIYSEAFVRGRMYSYLKFEKYMTSVADIVCKELDIDDEIVSVSLNTSGNTVFVYFKDNSLGFDSCFLWDKNLKNTIENYIEQ